VDLKSVIVVLDEAQFLEFVHEKTHPRARCANHSRQHLLGNFRKHLLRLGFLAVVSELQKSPSQSFRRSVERTRVRIHPRGKTLPGGSSPDENPPPLHDDQEPAGPQRGVRAAGATKR
jgi:hypothetical protein